MKKNLIENEIKKMKSLITYNIGDTINEQTEVKYGCKSSKDYQMGSPNEISKPTVGEVNVLKNRKGTPVEIETSFIVYFMAAKSSDLAFGKVFDIVYEKVAEILGAEKKDAKYNLELLEIKDVVGSASNYLSGPLQPNYDNSGKPMSPQLLSKPPYDTLPKAGDTTWDSNMGYAEARWTKLIKYIQGKEGKKKGISIAAGGVKPQQITAKITNTGGCNDETRNTKDYPKSGQYVKVQMKMKLVPRPLTAGQKETMFNCAQGLRIIIGYFKNGGGVTKIDGIDIPANSRQHGCDYATFDILCNGIPVGIANMNNGEQFNSNNPKVKKGITQSDNPNLVQRKNPSNVPKEWGKGETVYSVFSVKDKLLKQVIEKSPTCDLKLTIRGTEGSLTRDSTKTKANGLKEGYHGDAPMVCAYTVGRGGKLLKQIYGPKEPFGKIKGDVPRKGRTLIKFNPCVVKK